MMKNRTRWVVYVACILTVLLLGGGSAAQVMAQTEIPPVRLVIFDDFSSGTLDFWEKSSPSTAYVTSGSGYGGTPGLAVPIGSEDNSIYQNGALQAREGYLTFWFNPNGVSIPEPVPNYWPPTKSVLIAEVMNASHWWPAIVSLHLRRPPGEGYEAFLSWPTGTGTDDRQYDFENPFDISSGWQKITLGYHIGEWVAVWLNDELIRYTTDVVHADPYGDIVIWGKTRSTDTAPSGTLLFDDVSFYVPRVDDVWVNGNSGSDSNDGLTSGTAFKTIQRASEIAGPGATVHIMPGIYRETVWPALIGNESRPVVYKAESGLGTVRIRGSEASSSLVWTQLTENSIGLPSGVDPTNIYYADIASWGLEKAPRFVVELDGSGEVAARLPLAREPDWEVETEWKYHEFWWAADGGSYVPSCDPVTDEDHYCDESSRSKTQLTDRTNDTIPSGVEAGNLTTLGNLTGGTLVAMDTLQGHYVYRRTISGHNVSEGRVTVSSECGYDTGSSPGLGWGSKYYVENKPILLDTPGEWWYDTATGRLYLWPRVSGNPGSQSIEISRRNDGFDLQHRSYIILDHLVIEFLNGAAVMVNNWSNEYALGDTVRWSSLQYANWGVYLEKTSAPATPAGFLIDGFTLENSEVAYMDTNAVYSSDWWEGGALPEDFVRSRILNTLISGNHMHHLAYRSDNDNAEGSVFTYANKLVFEGNYIHHVAHNGVQFSKSVIQSSKTYDFSASEIKTGEILVKDNVFSKACMLATDCGGMKVWGVSPDTHVFRDFLITGNVFRNTMGWTYVSEQRDRWIGGTGSEVHGMGGFGLYVDLASGVHVYRNVAYNNAYAGFTFAGTWRDGVVVVANNIAANNMYGINLGGLEYDTHGSVYTRARNNIMINNEAYGLSLSRGASTYGSLSIDYDLYYNNGWRSYEDGGLPNPGAMLLRLDGEQISYATLADIQDETSWEGNGQSGNPDFWDYYLSDHDFFDGSWPDFHVNASSPAIDNGGALPSTTLTPLLEDFGLLEGYTGSAYDIGRYEWGFTLHASPSMRAMDVGGSTTFSVYLVPSDLPVPVTLTVSSPSLMLDVSFDEEAIAYDDIATLTVADLNSGSSILLPGVIYTIPITGTNGEYEYATSVAVLIGGVRIHMPVVLRDFE